MTIPTLRFNLRVPFPTQVSGSGIVKLTKSAGAWTVSLDFSQVSDIKPLIADAPYQQILLYNTQDKTFTTATLKEIRSEGALVQPTDIVFADTPYTPVETDIFLAIDSSGGAITIDLPKGADRSQVPLTIKDSSGDALTNNITITPNGSETIDGLAAYTINAAFGAVRLIPLTGGNWMVDA